jgi:hypothetical protein
MDLFRQFDDGIGKGSNIIRALNNKFTPPEAASRLRDAGIPGIRYLDGISRRAGDGSRNYVMFPGTEDAIRILRKYGLMAPIAAGAMQEER